MPPLAPLAARGRRVALILSLALASMLDPAALAQDEDLELPPLPDVSIVFPVEDGPSAAGIRARARIAHEREHALPVLLDLVPSDATIRDWWAGVLDEVFELRIADDWWFTAPAADELAEFHARVHSEIGGHIRTGALEPADLAIPETFDLLVSTIRCDTGTVGLREADRLMNALIERTADRLPAFLVARFRIDAFLDAPGWERELRGFRLDVRFAINRALEESLIDPEEVRAPRADAGRDLRRYLEYMGRPTRGGLTARLEDSEHADPWIVELVAGLNHVNHAWSIRGGSWANDVSEKDRRRFNELITKAGERLEKAWEIDATIPDAAIAMQRVARSNPIDFNPYYWFREIHQLDWDSSESMIQFTKTASPRWYGLIFDLIALGITAAETMRYDCRLPAEILRIAARMIADNRDPRTPFIYPEFLDAYQKVVDRMLALEWSDRQIIDLHSYGVIGSLFGLDFETAGRHLDALGERGTSISPRVANAFAIDGGIIEVLAVAVRPGYSGSNIRTVAEMIGKRERSRPRRILDSVEQFLPEGSAELRTIDRLRVQIEYLEAMRARSEDGRPVWRPQFQRDHAGWHASEGSWTTLEPGVVEARPDARGLAVLRGDAMMGSDIDLSVTIEIPENGADTRVGIGLGHDGRSMRISSGLDLTYEARTAVLYAGSDSAGRQHYATLDATAKTRFQWEDVETPRRSIHLRLVAWRGTWTAFIDREPVARFEPPVFDAMFEYPDEGVPFLTVQRAIEPVVFRDFEIRPVYRKPAELDLELPDIRQLPRPRLEGGVRGPSDDTDD